MQVAVDMIFPQILTLQQNFQKWEMLHPNGPQSFLPVIAKDANQLIIVL
jgi:hypothetical protein